MEIYGQLLLSSQINYTCTYLADHFATLNHDNVQYFLAHAAMRPRGDITFNFSKPVGSLKQAAIYLS